MIEQKMAVDGLNNIRSYVSRDFYEDRYVVDVDLIGLGPDQRIDKATLTFHVSSIDAIWGLLTSGHYLTLSLSKYEQK